MIADAGPEFSQAFYCGVVMTRIDCNTPTRPNCRAPSLWGLDTRHYETFEKSGLATNLVLLDE